MPRPFRYLPPLLYGIAWLLAITCLAIFLRGLFVFDKIYFTTADSDTAMWIIESDAGGVMIEHVGHWPRGEAFLWLTADRGRRFGPLVEPARGATNALVVPGIRYQSGLGEAWMRFTPGVEGAPSSWKAVGTYDLREGYSVPFTSVGVSYVLLMLLLVVPPVAMWVWRIMRRAKAARLVSAGRCRYCGYDLRATPGFCPECGAKRGSEG